MITTTNKTAKAIDDLISKVRELSAAKPANVYHHGSCEYAEGECSDGSTGCLLGQALLAMGFTSRRLRRLDALSVSSIGVVLPMLLGKVDLPPGKVQWLRCVQAAQDEEVAWGDAVNAADQEVPL